MKLNIPFFGKVEIKKLLLGYLYVVGSIVNLASAKRGFEYRNTDSTDLTNLSPFHVAHPCMETANGIMFSEYPFRSATMADANRIPIWETTTEIWRNDIHSDNTTTEYYKRVRRVGYDGSKIEVEEFTEKDYSLDENSRAYYKGIHHQYTVSIRDPIQKLCHSTKSVSVEEEHHKCWLF